MVGILTALPGQIGHLRCALKNYGLKSVNLMKTLNASLEMHERKPSDGKEDKHKEAGKDKSLIQKNITMN